MAPPPTPKGTSDGSISQLRRKLPANDGMPQGLKAILEDNAAPILHKVDNQQVDLESQSGSYNVTKSQFIVRSKKRFKKKLKIMISMGDKTFTSHTKDVSVGGFNLEDSVPEWVSGYFTVRISKMNSKQIIELNCCLVEDQQPGKRFRVAILPFQNHQDEKNLEQWFAA